MKTALYFAAIASDSVQSLRSHQDLEGRTIRKDLTGARPGNTGPANQQVVELNVDLKM